MVNIGSIAEKHSVEIYANLERLVNMNSFSTNISGLHAVSDILTDIASKHGIVLDKKISAEDSAQRPHLIYKNKQRDDYYAFIGHFDTVHPPDSDFNKLLKDGENWIGPGVNDMKNGVLIALYTLIILKELMPLEKIPLKILFNSDEEISSPTSSNIIKAELKNAKAGFVFESGRVPGDMIVTSRKGVIGLDIDVSGKPSHAGESPSTGINAIVDAATIIGKLNSLNSTATGVSIQCTEISGGTARNVVPDRCKIGVDIRVPTLQKQDKLLEEINHLLKKQDVVSSQIEYTIKIKRPPFVKTEKSARLIDSYLRIASDLGFPIEETSSGGVSDANNLSSFGVPVIDGLGALGNYPHTKKEYMIKQSLMDRLIIFSSFFYELIQEG
ncbi:MAG: M20/M25/M40 family metallo-hydrolase [Desulfuromusa sp.]|nr:M20/M25/M40 family metallo-hydrolase [Desulfuromusa sp.]